MMFWSMGPFWYMVYGYMDIWYENGICSVFAYVSCASCSGCLQHSAYIPCFTTINVPATAASVTYNENSMKGA